MRSTLAIIIKEDVQKILDTFSSCFNIRILFYSTAGEILKVGLNQPDSLFCRFIQNRLYGEDRCLIMDDKKRLEAARKREMLCYRCHAGLVEAIKPIFVENNLIGFAMIGQFRSRKDILPSIKKDWGTKYNLSELKKAFYELPYFPSNMIDHILELFTILVEYIVSKEMVAIKGNLVVDKITSYIKDNLTRKNITLQEAAEYAGKSISTVSHSFKEILGISFKQMCIKLKLDKAEEYLRTIPEITIKEVAEKLGYDDQFYFSRIYKKYRKIPPSKYLKNYLSKTT